MDAESEKTIAEYINRAVKRIREHPESQLTNMDLWLDSIRALLRKVGAPASLISSVPHGSVSDASRQRVDEIATDVNCSFETFKDLVASRAFRRSIPPLAGSPNEPRGSIPVQDVLSLDIESKEDDEDTPVPVTTKYVPEKPT